MFKITKRKEMADGTIILNDIKAPLIANKAKPGQFVILKANENGERIPLTIADTNKKDGTITVIYMVVGKSTAIFKSLKEKDSYPYQILSNKENIRYRIIILEFYMSLYGQKRSLATMVNW